MLNTTWQLCVKQLASCNLLNCGDNRFQFKGIKLQRLKINRKVWKHPFEHKETVWQYQYQSGRVSGHLHSIPSFIIMFPPFLFSPYVSHLLGSEAKLRQKMPKSLGCSARKRKQGKCTSNQVRFLFLIVMIAQGLIQHPQLCSLLSDTLRCAPQLSVCFSSSLSLIILRAEKVLPRCLKTYLLVMKMGRDF